MRRRRVTNEPIATGTPRRADVRQLMSQRCPRSAVGSCTFFQTTIEFRPTLLAQRDDACAKGQIRRAEIYDNLLTGLDTHEAS